MGAATTGFMVPEFAKHIENKYSYIDNAVMKEAFELTQEQIDKGMSKNLAEGDFEAAALMGVKSVFSDVVPSVGIAVIPAVGIPLLGMSAGGSFYADQRLRAASNRNSKAVSFLSAVAVGTVEALSERIFKQDLDEIRLAFKGGIPEGAAGRVAKGYISEMSNRGIKLVKDGSEEAVEEVVMLEAEAPIRPVVIVFQGRP